MLLSNQRDENNQASESGCQTMPLNVELRSDENIGHGILTGVLKSTMLIKDIYDGNMALTLSLIVTCLGSIAGV